MVILKNTLTKEKLFSTIDQEDIFEKYLTPKEYSIADCITQNKKLLNHFRGEGNPSISFKYIGDILYATDFAANWEFSGDCTNWAKLYYKYVKGELYTDFEILNKIIQDFEVDTVAAPKIFKKPKKEEVSYSTIKIEARLKENELAYSIQDKKYWMQFGIPVTLLPYFGVISCKKVWITNSEGKTEFYSNTKSTKDLIYAYRYGPGMYKIYQPLADSAIKWRSNISFNMVDDINLSTILKTTHILYDNDYKSKDNPGQKSALKFVEQFNLKNIRIPNKYSCTDISEFRALYGKDKTKDFLIKNFGDPKDNLILTKSRKDRMVLYTYGYQSYSLQSEGFIPNILPY